MSRLAGLALAGLAFVGLLLVSCALAHSVVGRRKTQGASSIPEAVCKRPLPQAHGNASPPSARSARTRPPLHALAAASARASTDKGETAARSAASGGPPLHYKHDKVGRPILIRGGDNRETELQYDAAGSSSRG